MVLQAEVSDMIAQAEQEVVVAIVMRAEEFVGLFDQVLVVVPDFLRSGKRGGAVGGNVHLGERIVCEFDNLEELASDYGRIDQSGEGNRRKLNFIAALACYGQWRSELPALGKFQAGCVIDIV